MPWDNNTGGGRNSNNGGPWGQVPGGGGGGGGGRRGGTPSLEDILSRGRDRFRGGVPGGRWAIGGIVAALLVFWGLNAFYTVDPNEVGVELLFGKPEQDLSQQGLHFHWWPVEQVEKVSITENKTSVGTVAGSRSSADEGLMLSGDQNIVNVKFTVLWAVNDPAKYLFDVRDPSDMVRSVAESAMRQVVGSRPAQDIFRDDKAGIQNDVLKIVQEILDQYGVGVKVNDVRIENAAPPDEVADAFDEVQRAEQDEDRFQEEARQYANTLLGDARGQAAQLREDAAAYKSRVVQEATGEAARFLSVYNEYIKAPEVTRKRLFLETMEQVLGGADKVLLEKGASGSGVVPYLPLPALRGGTGTSTMDTSTSGVAGGGTSSGSGNTGSSLSTGSK